MAVTHLADYVGRRKGIYRQLPFPWCEVFSISCDALALAASHLKSRDANRIRKTQNVAHAGPSRTIDLEIERFVVQRLKKLDVLVLSEESGFSHTRSPKYFAILDPIDGTSMAVRGMEFYSISIACGRLDNGRIFSRN